MKVSYNWIKEYLDVEMNPEDLGVIMTDIGLEVEGIEEVESVKGGLKGVVVGEVITRTQHANADRLSVCTVRLDSDNDPVQIVCGAKNVREGLKVLVATVGTTLYTEDGAPFKIKKGKIRGEESLGMICAEDELGLGSSHEGIMELESTAPVGTSAAEHLELTSDFIFDVGLTPNRSDATGHLGVAKDIRAYFNYHGLPNSWTSPEMEALNSSNDLKPIEVVIESTEACPRYSGILMNVKVGESPKWLKEKLTAIGVRPINNVVDITNFVLHEMGQPLHAFDYDKIDGHKIIVTKLDDGSEFVSLDEEKRNLNSEDLMICDGSRQPMCLAGVFGGLGSGVSERTTTIFLESAHFEAVGTRRSSTRHLLFTDSAKCFEKGSDPSVTVKALERAHFLLKKYASADVVGKLIDIYPNTMEPVQIDISLSTVNELLGHDFTKEEIEKVWTALEMPYTIDGSLFKVKVPTNKADVLRPADLVEEVLRIVGMNNIPIEQRLSYQFGEKIKFSSSHGERENISQMLSARGLHEAMGLSLTQSKWWEGDTNLVKINNTSNIHLNVMRPNIIGSLLESTAHNLNRQNDRVQLYEWGREYAMVDGDYQERDVLGIIATGKLSPLQWRKGVDDVDFYDIHQWVRNVLTCVGVASGPLEMVEDEVMSPCYQLRKGSMEIYRIGMVNKTWMSQMGVKQKVWGARIDWANVLKVRSSKTTAQPVSKFPKTSRDLALIMDNRVSYSAIEKTISKNGGKHLEEVALFDVYANVEQLGEHKKSYAVKMIFGKLDGTMKDGEVDRSVAQIIKKLESEHNVSIRS